MSVFILKAITTVGAPSNDDDNDDYDARVEVKRLCFTRTDMFRLGSRSTPLAVDYETTRDGN